MADTQGVESTIVGRFARYFIVEDAYQQLYEEFEAAESPEGWNAFRDEIVLEWFELYRQGLRDLGYADVGDLESYDWGTFTYSQNMTMTSEDEWWEQHRENPRIVAVHGFSTEVQAARDHARLRYHGATLLREFGARPDDYPFDKGHYIGHKLGGQIDNGIFAQRRDVNRGWGHHKGFYAMERFAQAHPGTFVFCRPIYGDGSSCPFFLEYGLLKPDGRWWVRVFPNRYSYTPYQGLRSCPDWRQKQIRDLRENAERTSARRSGRQGRAQRQDLPG